MSVSQNLGCGLVPRSREVGQLESSGFELRDRRFKCSDQNDCNDRSRCLALTGMNGLQAMQDVDRHHSGAGRFPRLELIAHNTMPSSRTPVKLQITWSATKRLASLMVFASIFSNVTSYAQEPQDETDSPPKSQATSRLEELMKQLEQLDREADKAENAVEREGRSNDQPNEADQLADEIINGQTRVIPKLVDGRFALPNLEPPSIATGDIGNGSIPKGFAEGDRVASMPLPQSGMQRPIDSAWAWSTKYWAAPNTFSNPRYFEDRMLERHGQTRWGYLQPFASGARFFTTIPMLPYKATIEPPCECQYTLGYLRAGSCTPAYIERPPWDRRAILAESAAVAGGMLIFP